ncbi:hypothetical protein JOF28_000650 [Leucobacter exalbidus]|uniref:Uncharacterized protein n=1 Tax=Leucobacter exalbidus TaxID=662960 RepID=A0A940PLR1_9MICO|nr:hypothetical protein [Leucobacter exalbidus]MBP1325418.1 hypothetical protein [Leucobacter exalbidus]
MIDTLLTLTALPLPALTSSALAASAFAASVIDIVPAAFTVSMPWSSDSEGSAALWLLGPGAGIAFYMFHYLRYRNTNQRHAFERETKNTVANVTGDDRLVGRVRDVQNRMVPGDNSSQPRQRLGQATHVTEE